MHNEELHELQSLPDIISYHVKEDEVVGVCDTHGGEKYVQGFGGET